MRRPHEAIGQHARFLALALAMLGGPGLAAAQYSRVANQGLDEIRRLIGDAACVSDDECRTLAVGVQACGGPAAFLAWSTRCTSPEALYAAVAAYDGSRRAEVARGGAVSTCRVVTDPGATCVRPPGAGAGQSGRCMLGSPGERPRR